MYSSKNIPGVYLIITFDQKQHFWLFLSKAKQKVQETASFRCRFFSASVRAYLPHLTPSTTAP
jgi:hypothetical protein